MWSHQVCIKIQKVTVVINVTLDHDNLKSLIKMLNVSLGAIIFVTKCFAEVSIIISIFVSRK